MSDGMKMMDLRSQSQPRALTFMVTFQTPLYISIATDRGGCHGVSTSSHWELSLPWLIKFAMNTSASSKKKIVIFMPKNE